MCVAFPGCCLLAHAHQGKLILLKDIDLSRVRRALTPNVIRCNNPSFAFICKFDHAVLRIITIPNNAPLISVVVLFRVRFCVSIKSPNSDDTSNRSGQETSASGLHCGNDTVIWLVWLRGVRFEFSEALPGLHC